MIVHLQIKCLVHSLYIWSHCKAYSERSEQIFVVFIVILWSCLTSAYGRWLIPFSDAVAWPIQTTPTWLSYTGNTRIKVCSILLNLNLCCWWLETNKKDHCLLSISQEWSLLSWRNSITKRTRCNPNLVC